GQPQKNRGWIPIWHYPNDFTTSETRVTVPADWYVVGNGVLKSNVLQPGGKTRTFHWKMEQPHATYLLSLAAGPFDVKTDKVGDVKLEYVVPRGYAHLIDETFGETPALLAFYSELLGVPYPYPRYAQVAVYDFGAGVENITASLFAVEMLTNGSYGIRTRSGVIAHELSHQWFGDLVTYRHWGEVWLGEGFAMYFGQLLYAEKWRGKDEYAHELAGFTRAYLGESRRYRRPLSTHVYKSPEAGFDSHAYQKGALVLHTL